MEDTISNPRGFTSHRSVLYKIGTIVVLALALILPLRMVDDLVDERRALRNRVVQDVAQSGIGAQRLDGLVLVLPCTDRYDEKETLDNGRTVVRPRTVACDVFLLPERLGIDGELETEFRYRGIYPALVYRSRLNLEGIFSVPPQAAPPGMRRTWGTPQVALGLGDVRGIRSVPVLKWNGASAPFAAGAGKAPWAQGIHADVPLDPALGGEASFTLDLDLAGMQHFQIIPAAGEVLTSLSSPWPHPSFIGRFSPETRTVNDAGFQAAWRSSDLGTNVRQAFRRCVQGKCDDYLATTFGVSLVQPVDVYQRTYRALHYGILFVVLTFALFFLYEILAGLRMHPVQYALVGFALVAFFVLLLAFAEHIGFGLAYLIAAGACIALVGLYVRYVLGTRARAASLTGLLSGLYGALYMVLGSEDYALLMGALLLFSALAAFMLTTRKLDWYALSGPQAGRAEAE
ncbi:MAG: cell envelope integrity protein CreD [Burkholderiales bacterium]